MMMMTLPSLDFIWHPREEATDTPLNHVFSSQKRERERERERERDRQRDCSKRLSRCTPLDALLAERTWLSMPVL
jgi:hypothetical protein